MKKTVRPRSGPRQDPVLDPKAADEISRAVTSILKRLRAGHTVKLPGLGHLIPGKTTRLIPKGGSAGARAKTQPPKPPQR